MLHGVFSVHVSGDDALVAVCGVFIVVASFLAEHRLWVRGITAVAAPRL